ncbi:MBL fold metallo-hydrolase [Brevibacillus ginsengisoli]|uniref:MBL fold metallo-hydrolase n=1 Tax=Brevibacillus ginsengisoli TaxID=363854 RepID=UPI003CEAC45C
MKQFSNVTVFTSCLWQINSTIVERPDRIYVFDPAYFPHEIERITQYVTEIQRNRPISLVFTHGDWDHIVGYREFADATVIAHEAINKDDQLAEQIAKAKQFDARYYVDRGHELLIPQVNQQITADCTVENRDGVVFIPTPGHTHDMMATYFVHEKVLVAGDMLSDLEFPFIYHDSSAYLSSLKKLKQLLETREIELLIPGHGHCTTNLSEMMKRIEQDVAYVEAVRELVFGLVEQGHSKEQIWPEFQTLRYKGEEIGPSLMGQHESNLDQLILEANRQ